MRPTRLRTLLGLVLVVGGLSYLVFRLVYGDLPALPSYSPLTLLLVALLNGYLALAVRDRRKAARPVRVEPLVVARYAALAKASNVLGATFLGLYLGLLGYLVGGLDKTQLRADARTAGFGAGSALLLVAAALWLERACRLPPRPEAKAEAKRD